MYGMRKARTFQDSAKYHVTARAHERFDSVLDYNPVRAELTGAPEEWKWGALWLRRTGPPAWLCPLSAWLKGLFPCHQLLSLN